MINRAVDLISIRINALTAEIIQSSGLILVIIGINSQDKWTPGRLIGDTEISHVDSATNIELAKILPEEKTCSPSEVVLMSYSPSDRVCVIRVLQDHELAFFVV